MEWEDICQDKDGFWRHTPSIIPARVVQLSEAEEDQIDGDCQEGEPGELAGKPGNQINTLSPDQAAYDGFTSPTSSTYSSPRSDLQVDKYALVLSTDPVDLDALRRLAWKGIPTRYRALTWKLLIVSFGLETLYNQTLNQGYLPNYQQRHRAVVERKHCEYKELVSQHFGPTSYRDPAIMHQIAIDVPRTAPDVPLFRNSLIREALARILYCASIRRPASGYVQGINDLVTPFFDVFLSNLQGDQGSTEDLTGTLMLSEGELSAIEVDTFWCFSRLLDSIQDNYTYNQSGISRQLSKMRDILRRTDPKLIAHLDSQEVTFIQFAFRWMNCMLIREFPLHMIIRMWDTYLAEGEEGFSSFHIYVCAALLSRWASRLQLLDFQEIILFLQNPPTATWTLGDVDILLSEAYVWKTLFHDSASHLKS